MKIIFDRPNLLLTLTALFWAGNFVLGRSVVGLIPPVALACLRWTIATLIFLPFAWPHVRRDVRVIARNWPVLLFFGAGAGAYNTLSYLGLVYTEALNGLVLNAAAPLFIALAAWSLFGDRLERMQLLGLAAGFLGVLLIVAKGNLVWLAGLGFNPGDLLLLIALVAWCIYTACLRKRPPISWQSFNLSTYALAAVGNMPFALLEYGLGQHVTWGAPTFAAIAYVAIFPSLLAYIFYNRGVELLGPARAGFYLFLIPVFGSLLAVIALGERLHLYHGAGFVLIIFGVLSGSRRRTVEVLDDD